VPESPGRQCPTTETADAAGEEVLETPGGVDEAGVSFAAAHADGRPQRVLPQKSKLESLNLVFIKPRDSVNRRLCGRKLM
jgi:hypothetical protein